MNKFIPLIVSAALAFASINASAGIVLSEGEPGEDIVFCDDDVEGCGGTDILYYW